MFAYAKKIDGGFSVADETGIDVYLEKPEIHPETGKKVLECSEAHDRLKRVFDLKENFSAILQIKLQNVLQEFVEQGEAAAETVLLKPSDPGAIEVHLARMLAAATVRDTIMDATDATMPYNMLTTLSDSFDRTTDILNRKSALDCGALQKPKPPGRMDLINQIRSLINLTGFPAPHGFMADLEDQPPCPRSWSAGRRRWQVV